MDSALLLVLPGGDRKLFIGKKTRRNIHPSESILEVFCVIQREWFRVLTLRPGDYEYDDGISTSASVLKLRHTDHDTMLWNLIDLNLDYGATFDDIAKQCGNTAYFMSEWQEDGSVILVNEYRINPHKSCD